jgi:CubicO group peptidase (beta-lactamase class C family)
VYDYGLKEFARLIEERKLSVYGALVYQHGRNVGETHWVNDQPFDMYSLSKSFTSTAIGIAVDEGILSLDDRPIDILRESAPEKPSEALTQLKLRNLLTMASGHEQSYLLRHQRALLETRDWVR